MAEHLFGTCRIQSLNEKGLGIGESEHGEIQLPFTLPGETVHYERFMKHPNSKREKPKFFLKGLEDESSNRQEAVCKHFTQCGGCMLQHLNAPTYAKFKKSIAEKTFISESLDTNCINEPIFLPAGERRRANFEIVKKNEQVFLGFHRWRSHQIINLEECHTVCSSISSLFEPIRQLCLDVMQAYQKATVYITETAVGIDMIMFIHKEHLVEEGHNKLHDFAQEHKLARLIVKEGKRYTTILETEKPYVVIDDTPVKVEAMCFLQASNRADKVLTDLVLNALPKSTHKIADLFCGRGTFTLPLSKVAPVDGYECDQPALNALNEAIEVSKRPITANMRNLFESPLTPQELNQYDVVMLDPPRAGAEAQVEQLAQSNVPKVIYVSCGPESFARDAKRLIEAGYHLEHVTPVDQFIWSPHLELVGIFSK